MISVTLALLTSTGWGNLPKAASEPATIKVYVVGFFPTSGKDINGDIAIENKGMTYADLHKKTVTLTDKACRLLQEGSRFHGYKDPSAKAALKYQIVGRQDFKESIPLSTKKADPKLPDYGAIIERIGGRKLIEEQGVQEIWMWGYHGHIGLWESNMSSPTGDVSNSDRDETDLPVYKKTYTFYHYNYGRGVGEMLENHMHQLEHVLNFADGRDVTPEEKWSDLLFWGKFVGSDVSHKIVTKPARCGWTHYAPNSESDYDWANPRFIETDIEDWMPDGIGKTQRLNADRWDRDAVKWRVYWMQAVPSVNNGLTYRGKPLRNWWTFIADWDSARRNKWKLWAE